MIWISQLFAIRSKLDFTPVDLARVENLTYIPLLNRTGDPHWCNFIHQQFSEGDKTSSFTVTMLIVCIVVTTYCAVGIFRRLRAHSRQMSVMDSGKYAESQQILLASVAQLLSAVLLSTPIAVVAQLFLATGEINWWALLITSLVAFTNFFVDPLITLLALRPYRIAVTKLLKL